MNNVLNKKALRICLTSNRKIISMIVFIIITINFASVQSLSQTDTIRINAVQTLKTDINSLISNPDFSSADIGICVQAVESGEYLYMQNESKNFIPASTQKVLTTAAAFDILGPNFKFATKLYLDGIILPTGEFVGNVIIRGMGDPSISKYYFKEPLEILDNWARILDSMGINSIKGNIIGDDSYFDNTYYGPGWSWDDFSYTYSSQVSALSINDNRVDFFIYSGDSIGASAGISSYPSSQYFRIVNNIRTSKSSDEAEIDGIRETGTNILKLSGAVPYDNFRKKAHSLSVTIDNPTLFFLNLFKQVLDNRRISFSGGLLRQADLPSRINYAELNPVIEHFSPTVSEIISIINQESHNLAAEMLLKTLGKENSGTGTYNSGAEFLRNYLGKAGVNQQNVKIVDGSGLSRLNLISPRNQVSILNYIYRSSFKDYFVKSLARPGEPGTLKRRMTRSKAEKSVTAKTGSMNYISAICGYVNSRDGETFAFSIMFQNFTVPLTLAHNLQDLILMRLSTFSRN